MGITVLKQLLKEISRGAYLQRLVIQLSYVLTMTHRRSYYINYRNLKSFLLFLLSVMLCISLQPNLKNYSVYKISRKSKEFIFLDHIMNEKFRIESNINSIDDKINLRK